MAELASHPADAVVYNLSAGNFRQEISQLKEAYSPLAVLVLSEKDDMENAVQAVKFGAQDYLLRGQDDGHSFCRAVRYAVEREKVEEALRRANDELEDRVEERTSSLKELNRQLSMEHGFVRALLNTVDAIVIVLDAAGKVLSVNRCFEMKTGQRSEQVRGQTMQDLTRPLEGEDGGCEVDDPITGVLCSGLHCADGSLVNIRWTNTSLFDVHGKIKNIILTGIDITEQHRAEMLSRQRLLEMGHLGRLMTMGEMATEIAHELNQPLGAIASYSDSCIRLLEEGEENLDLVRQGLREIERQALRSADIIKHIRSFTRKESKDYEQVDVNEMFDDVEDLIRAEARWNKVQLSVERSSGVTRVRADRVLLEQVVLNMARNAIEAMADIAEGERALHIRVTGDEESVGISVEDNGPGIVDDGNVFEAFYTTKSEGMGLGLAICHSIVASLGGQVWGKNRPAGGASFGFSIPASGEEQ